MPSYNQAPQILHCFNSEPTVLIPSKRRKYSYRLLGIEDDWHVVSENTARYTNLGPGKYTFEVFGTNNDGLNSLTPATMSFTILPPFYQSWWFILACAALTLTAFWLIYRQFMLRNKLALARTRIQLADDLHDDIGSQLMAISLSLNFLSSRKTLEDNEMKELARQSGIADTLGQELRDHVWLVDAKQDSLNNLTRRMELFLSSFSSSIDTSFQGPPPSTDRAINPSWRRNVYLIYKEAVQNALKHAEATKIKARVSVSQSSFSFSVEDNGKGYNPGSSSVGRGMSTMRRRSEQINGKLTIKSSPNAGTTITFNGSIV